MNKTKRIFVATMLVLVVLMITTLAGCSNNTDSEVPSHAHTLTRVAPKAATCTEDGNREHYICDDCGGVFADANGNMVIFADQYVIRATGHNVASHGAKDSTCFTEGVMEHYECRICHLLFKDAEGMFEIGAPGSLPTLTHSISKVEKKPAVGFTPGYEEHYYCSGCNKIYEDAQGKVETTYEAIKIAPVLTDFEYKIAFTPAANIESINGTSGADYISATYVTAENGLPATQYTFKAGATAGREVEAWIHSVVGQTMANGQNLRVPTFSGTPRVMEVTVKNEGNQDISFRYYAENYGDKGGVDITVGAGETKTFKFEVNPGSSIGCNYALKLTSDVSEETKVTMNGYFYCEGEVDRISEHRAANKTSFKVGEAFTTEGLVVRAHGTSYDEVVIANYLTDIEAGYVFTAGDIGTKTVTVAYGEYTFTYEITITA